METLQLTLQVTHPGERYTWSRGLPNDVRPVGVSARILVGQYQVIEGEVDPQCVEALVESIEENLVWSRVQSTDAASALRVREEGWLTRWLEGAARRLKDAIQKDLEIAMERLTQRHEQLKRLP